MREEYQAFSAAKEARARRRWSLWLGGSLAAFLLLYNPIAALLSGIRRYRALKKLQPERVGIGLLPAAPGTQAALAMRKGREDLAREALGEKVSQAAFAEDLRAEAARQKARVTQLKSAYEGLTRQFEEVRRRKPVWLARARRMIGTKGSKDAYCAAYGELSRIAGEVEGQAAVEDVLAELERPLALEETLGDMSRIEVIDREMDALKQRLRLQE